MSFSIESVKDCSGGFKYALFDFDGTVSLIREGWQQVMISYFCEVLEALPTGEAKESICAEVTEIVDRLTGQQTVFPCMALDEAVFQRGGPHREPEEYKKEYLRRLNLKIADKKKALASGGISSEKLSLKGVKRFLEALRAAGIRCFLVSGTDEADVLYEARLLGVDKFFDGGIHGASDMLRDSSEKAVIKKLAEKQNLCPQELITFGAGFAEIELTSSLGGFAVGVAADEKNGCGIDLKKRERLLSAGAGMIIPHYDDTDALMKALKIV